MGKAENKINPHSQVVSSAGEQREGHEEVHVLVLDIPRRSPSHFSHIDVPLYHRVHLALTEGVPVHGCLLAGLSPPHLPELVISPFDFARWDKLWRLSVSLNDRAGLLHDVCDTLKRNGANILAGESGMMEEQNVYHIEMIIEMEDEERIELIEWSLQSRLFSEHILLPDGTPRLRIRRLRNLWLAKKAYERQRMKPLGFIPLNEELNLTVLPQKVLPQRPTSSQADLPDKQSSKAPPPKFRLSLPPSIRTVLNHEISRQVAHRNDEGFYLRLSDTKDRFLRVLFFRATDPVIHARLEYKDRLGAAADVTSALSESGFNILAAYLGPAEGGNRSRCEVIVRCDSLSGKLVPELKGAFEQALGSSTGTQDLQMTVGYPGSYAYEWERKELGKRKKLSCVCAVQPENEHGEINWISGLKNTLDSQYEELYRKVSRGIVSPERDDVRRWAFVQKLRKQYCDLWPMSVQGSNGKSLFVSCHYHGNQLELIKRQATAKGFVVFTGEDLVRDPNITAGLLKRINSCTHFLGAWSRDGAQKCGEEYWPSPWLLWEFGVAEAFDLVWRLLISKDLSQLAWTKLSPHVQNLIFDSDFETKVKEILDVLSEIPERRLPWQRHQ